MKIYENPFILYLSPYLLYINDTIFSTKLKNNSLISPFTVNNSPPEFPLYTNIKVFLYILMQVCVFMCVLVVLYFLQEKLNFLYIFFFVEFVNIYTFLYLHTHNIMDVPMYLYIIIFPNFHIFILFYSVSVYLLYIYKQKVKKYISFLNGFIFPNVVFF